MTPHKPPATLIPDLAASSEPVRLSLAQCRELLPLGFEVEDAELERVRDQFYALAEAMLDEGSRVLPRQHERAG